MSVSNVILPCVAVTQAFLSEVLKSQSSSSSSSVEGPSLVPLLHAPLMDAGDGWGEDELALASERMLP
jgi:hypothetical protein